MKLCQFHLPGQGTRVGVVVGDEVIDVTSPRNGVPSVLALRVMDMRDHHPEEDHHKLRAFLLNLITGQVLVAPSHLDEEEDWLHLLVGGSTIPGEYLLPTTVPS